MVRQRDASLAQLTDQTKNFTYQVADLERRLLDKDYEIERLKSQQNDNSCLRETIQQLRQKLDEQTLEIDHLRTSRSSALVASSEVILKKRLKLEDHNIHNGKFKMTDDLGLKWCMTRVYDILNFSCCEQIEEGQTKRPKFGKSRS